MKMYRLKQNQTGIAHLLPIAAVALAVLGGTGYFVYQHHLKTISLHGTLSRVDCNRPSNKCTGYTLKSDNNKTYSLDIGATTKIPGSSEVTVTGTTAPANPTQVTVQTIKPTPSSTSASTTPSVSPSANSTNPTSTSSTSTTTYPQDVTFNSTVTADTCSRIDHPSGLSVGDVGCSITTANGYTIAVRKGNTASTTPPGSLNNAPAYTQTWIGKNVNVYANATAAGQATILSNSKYYVTFTD